MGASTGSDGGGGAGRGMVLRLARSFLYRGFVMGMAFESVSSAFGPDELSAAYRAEWGVDARAGDTVTVQAARLGVDGRELGIEVRSFEYDGDGWLSESESDAADTAQAHVDAVEIRDAYRSAGRPEVDAHGRRVVFLYECGVCGFDHDAGGAGVTFVDALGYTECRNSDAAFLPADLDPDVPARYVGPDGTEYHALSDVSDHRLGDPVSVPVG